jgi:aspartate kinase
LLDCPPPTSSPAVAKLSVFGVGMKSHTDVASRMFRSLATAGINVDMISTSEVRVNVVINGDQAEAALRVLTEEFEDVMV